MLNKIYKNYDVNKKYAIRKFAIGTFSVAIGLLATNMNELPIIGFTGPNIVHASEVTNWHPEGNIIAQGEDGVPWELYENGYLLFKPVEGKDTLANEDEDGYNVPTWKTLYGGQIKYVGFSGKVYAPEYSGGLFSPYSNGDNFKFQPENIETNKIDTSKVKSMYYMFGNNTSISNLDLSNWDTSNVTSMKSMFRGTSLKKLNLNNWDTSNVTDMSFMFSESNNITELDLNHLNTGKVKDMNNMFNNMKSLTTLNIENWDTSNVINMSSMFADSKSITSLNLNNWNTGNVTDMNHIFSGTENLKTLNIDKLDTHNVINMQAMFFRALSLKELDLNNWDTSNVTNMSWMFTGAESITKLLIKNWNTSKVTTMTVMFSGMDKLLDLDISDWNTSSLQEMGSLCSHCHSLKNLNLSNWDTSKVTDMNGVFASTDNLETLDLTGWDTSKVEKAWYMLEEAPKLRELRIGGKFLAKGIESIGEHSYGDRYTNKWQKIDKSDGPFTVTEWAKAYSSNPSKFAGVWVRESLNQPSRLIFEDENIPPLTIAPDVSSLPELPKPTKNKENHKFVGWARTSEDKPIDVKTIKPGEDINLHPIWEPVDTVDTVKTRTEKISIVTSYKADNNLDYGKQNEEQGEEGEKEITTTYQVEPYTGKLINPTETEKIIKEMKPKIIKVGTKPKVVIEDFESPVVYVKDGTREKGSENEFAELGYKGSKYVRTTYKLNEKTGEITPVESEPVIVNPTKTIVKVAAKDKVEIIKSNDKTIQRTTTYDVNPETGEITISSVTDKLISTNTPLIPNPEGADLPKVPEKNTNDKPEYTNPISTNTPTDDKGELILPPVENKPEFNGGVNSIEPPVDEKPEINKPVERNEKPSETLINEKPEYTGPLSTNTPIDENGNLILPPTIEKPEYKGSVNSAEPPIENKPEYTEPISTNTPVDDNGNQILPPVENKPEYTGDLTEKPKEEPIKEITKEETKVENKKEKELPNTNSTSVIVGFVSSLIGTLGLGYKSKRRK